MTVKSVGTTEANAGRKFDIGRGANECNITLALTDPESEGIGQYVLHGNASAFTFDGGVVKASSVTKDLFFTTASNAKPAARVTNNGVTFDTAGANTDLGLSLTVDAPRPGMSAYGMRTMVSSIVSAPPQPLPSTRPKSAGSAKHVSGR